MPKEKGQRAVFRETLPARLWWPLWPKVAAIPEGAQLLEALDWDTAVALCQATVESWPYAGDPGDAAAYDALEYDEMARLVSDAYRHLVELSGRRTAAAGE